ncbi:MAG: tetratricopeptide repeat protein, partial [Gammaproteobacteria bacterium]
IDLDPEDWETLYSIGLLDLEMDNFDSAENIFTRLVAADQRFDEAQFYLGFIDEQRDDLPAAIAHYREVRIGTNNFLAAQQQATQLSIRLGELEDAHNWLARLSRGQPRLEVLFNTVESAALIQAGYGDEAKALLDRALNKYPGETDLLFARVLYYDSQNDMAGSERDLRQIIRAKPDDSRALNHLGYMLADRTDRYEEALELAQQAIALEPDDPAIIDTLGWAQYKVGRLEEALANLQRAYSLFRNDEVAAHVGEVLWQLGREQEAVEVWREALEIQPDSQYIDDIVERFNPPL